MGGQSPAAVAYQSPSQSRRHGRDSPGVQRRRSRGHLGDDAFRRGSAQAASIRGAAHRGRHGRHSHGEPRGRVQVLLPAVHVRGKRIAYFSLLIVRGLWCVSPHPGARCLYTSRVYTSPSRMFYRGTAMREMPCCRQHLCCVCLSEFVRSKQTKTPGLGADAAGSAEASPSPSYAEEVPQARPRARPCATAPLG